jgi:predicted Zn-dependent peptidase
MKVLNVNNTKVVHHYLPSKLTNIQIMTNIGSAAEEKDNWGCAHMLEHNYFLGSKKYPGRSDIQTIANDIGGRLNAFTWIDITSYHITTLNDFFREGFDILADMYQNPLFPEEEFKKEINPILSEMRRAEDDPDRYLGSRVYMDMLGEKVAHPIVGTEETIKSMTLEKLHAFRDKYYGGDNVMISVVGGIKEEEVAKIVGELFNVDRKTDKPEVPKVEYKSGEMILTKPGITEAVYSLTYPALPRFNPERYKQSLMTYILGGNESGMLFETIREQLGLSCYGVYASQIHFDSHNLLDISTGIAPDEIDKCHTAVLSQIDRICNDKIDEKRLNRAKASLRTGVASASENSSGYNTTIALPIIKGETENPLEKLLARIEETTIDDIRDIAQKTFTAKPYKGVLLPE